MTRASLALLCAGAIALPAQADSAADAEALVQVVYYEGVPEEAARELDDRAVARLAEMLLDSGEAEHHGNIVSVLGMCGHPRAYEALASYAAQPVTGEVDRNTFRARTRLPSAMGRLAHDDGRALGWLLERSADRSPPAWTFRHQRGAKLALLLEDQNLTGLALTGSPEALAVLRRAQQGARGSGAAAEHRRRNIALGIETHGRVAREGIDVLREGEGVAR